MSKNYKLTINCESSEMREAVAQILMMSKNQLEQHLTMILQQQGISSDTKVSIKDKEIFITQTTGDRGIVIVSNGIGYQTAGYDTLPNFAKYIVAERGGVFTYVKMPNNIDVIVGQYEDINAAAAAINSNDVVDATANLERKFNESKTKTEDEPREDNVIEIGDTEETV